MAKIEQLTDKHGETVYPVSKEAAISDENGVLLSNKISTFITRLVDNLANYYLKSELYTKEEIDTLIGAIQGFSYIVVSELPTASAFTMGTIYLVPSADPQTQNIKDEYITIRSGSIGSYTYSWEQIGSTAIDLSGYVTTNALNAELAKYTTTANLTALLAGKQNTISDLSTIRSGAAAGAAAYQKPSAGIPGNDLNAETQYSLELANSAVQAEHIGSIIPPVDPSEFATKDDVEELDLELNGYIGDEDITPTMAQGYYYTVSGTTISVISSGTSWYNGDASTTPPTNGVDISAYVGKTLKVTVSGISATSSRCCAILNSSNTVVKSWKESEFTADGTKFSYSFTVPAASKWLFLSGSSSFTLESVVVLSGEVVIGITQRLSKTESDIEALKDPDLRVAASASADLDIEDGSGNIIARLSEGHIETKNFNSKDVGGITQDEAQSADLEFTDAESNAIVRFVDGHIKTKNFDSSSVLAKLGYQRETYFDIRSNCTQMNASSFIATAPNTYVEQVLYDDHAVLILPETYTKGGTPTRLIVFCKQGNSQITDDSNPIMVSNSMGNIFHFLVSRGYAVLAADGVPDGLSSSLGLDDTRVSGNYVAVQSTRKAYDYVIKNYNIYDDGAFIFGYSQGGMYAQNVIDLSGIPFLGCAMVSPALSMRYHLWDLATSKTIGGVSWTRTSRLNIARLYGFDAVTTNAELLALQFDKEKVAGYDPWNRNVENPYEGFTQTSSYGSNLWALPEGTSIDSITMKKKIGCPTKIWVAENDATLGADITKVFVKACRNAGQMCDLRLYSSGNHHIFQSTYQSPAITTFSDSGVTYNLYAIAYEIASFFYSLGGYPLS